MAEKFEGFANAPTNKKGQRLNFRSVPAFVDESDEGKVRLASQTTPSTIVTGREPAVDESDTTEVADAAEGKGASGS